MLVPVEFIKAAAYAEVVFNCVAGIHALELVTGLEPQLRNKILVDVSNPLDFSSGTARLTTESGTSLGEQIQAVLPDTKVVKTLNTVTSSLMINPNKIPGNHILPICGNDAAAKNRIGQLMLDFGWRLEQITDLGSIKSARGMESYLMFWLSLYELLGTADFNIEIRK